MSAKKYRTYRTLLLANKINETIGKGGFIVINTNEFIDSPHIQEVVEVSSRLAQTHIWADVSDQLVSFHCDG